MPMATPMETTEAPAQTGPKRGPRGREHAWCRPTPDSPPDPTPVRRGLHKMLSQHCRVGSHRPKRRAEIGLREEESSEPLERFARDSRIGCPPYLYPYLVGACPG